MTPAMRLTPSAALAALLLCAPAAAQTLPSLPLSGAAGVGLERYEFTTPGAVGTKALQLLTVPVTLRAQAPAGVSVEVSAAWARGELTRADGTTATLEGPTDTYVRVARTFGRDRLTLALLGAIPTGRSTQTQDEAAVADAVASDLLPLRVSNWGSGGGVGVSAAYAVSAGGFGLGVSGGYTMARAFEPADGQPAQYRPGNEALLRVAADRTLGRGAKASLAVTWQGFGADELEGRNLYRSGDRLQAIASLQGVAAGMQTLVYGGLLHRENGTVLDPGAVGAPVQDLWLGGGGLRISTPWGAVVPSVDARLFRSGDGRGQGWYAGMGGSAEVRFRGATLVPSARLRVGEIVAAADRDSGISGFDLGLAVRHGR